MKTSTFVRFIFLKDLRALRYALLLLLGVAVVALGSWAGLNQEGNNGVTSAVVSPICVALLLVGMFLLTVHLIQSDPAGREFRFLLTRPVPGAAVGVAKALFLTVFLFVPFWIGLEATVIYAQVPFTPLDHFLLLIETGVTCGGAVACIVLLSIFLRNGLSVFITYVVYIIATSYLTMVWNQRAYHMALLPTIPNLERQRVEQLGAFLCHAIFVFVALFAIGWRYRTKAFKAPLIIALVGLVLCYMGPFWPYNFIRAMEDPLPKHDLLTPEQLGRIRLSFVNQVGRNSYNISGGGWNNVHYATLNQTVRMEGVAAPYYVQTVGYHAVITLRSGKTVASDYGDFPSHGGVGGLNPALMAAAAGVLPPWPASKEQQLDLLSYIPKSLPNEDITGATIKGAITLDVRRAYVAGTLPLRQHASFDLVRSRYEITNTDFSNDGVKVDMSVFSMPLVLRGDLTGINSTTDLQWLLVYRPYAQALAQGGSSSGGGMDLGVHVRRLGYDYRSVDNRTVPGWRPLPSDWASRAELVLIDSESCGQVSLPYEIDNVDLHSRF